MTTTDTRAALDAAIDRIAEVWTSFMRTREVHPTAPIELADWMAPKTLTDPLRTAITAHVEAEVARRLAVAPSATEALHDYLAAFNNAGDTVEAGKVLRAAIAADRDRAVEAGSLAALDELRKLLPKYVTPDEARRLVGEFAGAHGAMVAHLAGMPGPESGEDVAARAESARAAILRALGVEA